MFDQQVFVKLFARKKKSNQENQKTRNLRSNTEVTLFDIGAQIPDILGQCQTDVGQCQRLTSPEVTFQEVPDLVFDAE